MAQTFIMDGVKGKVMTFETVCGMSRDAYDRAKAESDAAIEAEAEAEENKLAREKWRPV